MIERERVRFIAEIIVVRQKSGWGSIHLFAGYRLHDSVYIQKEFLDDKKNN